MLTPSFVFYIPRCGSDCPLRLLVVRWSHGRALVCGLNTWQSRWGKRHFRRKEKCSLIIDASGHWDENSYWLKRENRKKKRDGIRCFIRYFRAHNCAILLLFSRDLNLLFFFQDTCTCMEKQKKVNGVIYSLQWCHIIHIIFLTKMFNILFFKQVHNYFYTKLYEQSTLILQSK